MGLVRARPRQLDQISDTASRLAFQPAERTKLNSLALRPTIAGYGAVSGGPDAATAVAAMVAAVGYAMVPAGMFTLGTTTIDAPITFEPGGAFVLDAAATLTIRGPISSPSQHIFRGDGTYVLGNDSNSGEDAREIHISWFGGKPTAAGGTEDQGPIIQRALTAMGNARESVISFDIGNYKLGSAVIATRGAHIKGDGTRRTVFLIDPGAGPFDCFTTNGIACKFSDIQFESDANFSGRGITILHGECEVRGVYGRSFEKLIDVTGANAVVSDVMGVYGTAVAAGSYLVRVGGSGAIVDTVRVPTSSTHGPDAVVKIGGATAISGCSVSNIYNLSTSRPLLIDSTSGPIYRVSVENIMHNGFNAGASTDAIKILAGGANGIEDVVITRAFITSAYANGIVIQNSGTGVINGISVDSSRLLGNGTAVNVIADGGSGGITDVWIGSANDFTAAATPIAISGSVSKIRAASTTWVNGANTIARTFSVADDSVISVPLLGSLFSGRLSVTAGSTNYADYVIRAASSPVITQINASANVNSVAAVLTGTTGTDGKITVGVQSGVIYVENRLGSTQTITVVVNGSTVTG